MTQFILAASALLVAALLLLLRPWRKPNTQTPEAPRAQIVASLYRDALSEIERDRANGLLSDADHAQARAEIERRVLEDSAGDAPMAAPSTGRGITWAVLAGSLPIAAVALYVALGTPAALDERAVRGVTAADVEQMVAGLAARLEDQPDDPKGWAMLARSYRMMQRFPQAARAFERIGPTLEQDPDLLAAYADVLGMLAGGELEGRPSELLNRALKLAPDHPLALSLAATAATRRQDKPTALALWRRLEALLPPGSEDAGWVQQQVAALQAGTGGNAQAPGQSISGRVSLAPQLAGAVNPNDTLFIFARAAQGSRMPLAILRKKAGDLPLEFHLDDSLAMNPAAKLSSAAQVVVEARISKSGQATPSKGDLFVASEPLAPGASGLALRIDRVRGE